MAGRLILGTSGFSYAHWRERFYPHGLPQSRWLEYYATHFSAVELNVTFYRLPRRETFGDWARRTPDGFRFIVKGSRIITHYRRLGDVREAAEALRDAAGGLGEKLDCMLWQLPPTMEKDARRLDEFCALATVIFPDARHAFEFRARSWFAEDIYDVLREHGAALVWADPGSEGQSRVVTTDFAYARLHHGPRESGAYKLHELEPLSAALGCLISRGLDAYALFNNDPGGWAIVNADEFGKAVEDAVACGAVH